MLVGLLIGPGVGRFPRRRIDCGSLRPGLCLRISLLGRRLVADDVAVSPVIASQTIARHAIASLAIRGGVGYRDARWSYLPDRLERRR